MEFEDRPADTSPKIWECYLDLIRQMTPAEKLSRTLQASDELLGWTQAGVRFNYPGASEHEVRLRTASRYLDRHTMIRAYGWDPDSNEPVPDRP